MPAHNLLTGPELHEPKTHAASHVDGTDNIQTATSSRNGLMTSTYASKLDGIETAADVTDATNVAAAGAVMEGDTSTANMDFVVDEDSMASNSATLIPTQQSVKAYADLKLAKASNLGDLADTTTARTNLGLGSAATMTGPSGTIVGTTDTQTLSGKTLTQPVLDGSPVEEEFTVTDGASVDLDPDNGTLQVWTLGANRAPTATNFANGQSMLLKVADGTAYALDLATSMSVVWVGAAGSGGGSAPTLATSGYTMIELWKQGGTIYAALVGEVAS